MSQSLEKQLPRVPLAIIFVCWLFMFGSFLLPQIELDGQLANAAVIVINTGSYWGLPAIVSVLALLLVSRAGVTWKRRLLEFSLILTILAVSVVGGSWLNEELLKPLLGVHRPNIVGMDEDRSLGMSLEAFYGMPTNAERSDWLKQILENKYFEGIKLSEPVRQHWITAGGFSLPSSFTLGAFFVLTFSLLSTWTVTSDWKFALASLLIPWSLAVCYSGILLRTNWPNDLIVSAMAGILMGIGIFKFFQWILWRPTSVANSSEINADLLAT